LLPPKYRRLGVEALFVARNRPFEQTLRTLACLIAERAYDPVDLPQGPEVKLLDEPANSGADRPAPVVAAAGVEEVGNRLPPGAGRFSGRREEMEILSRLRTSDRSAGVPRVVAIYGMAGVGKTALALHFAHKLAEEATGHYTGFLYVDLQACSVEKQPMSAFDALGELLVESGVPAAMLPASKPERVALWRERAGRERLLVVLDNAADSTHVGPLIPAARECLVLVTSRCSMADLGAPPVKLDPLPRVDSEELFRSASERKDFTAEELGRLLDLAGELPLAITILAGLYDRRARWTMGNLIAHAQERSLDIAAEDKTINAAFELSYLSLTDEEKRIFSLLGVHPGRTIDRKDAAALTGALTDQDGQWIGSRLDHLCNMSLLEDAGAGRYTMHGLIRRYATGKARQLPASERDRALAALVGHYLMWAQKCATEAGWALLRHDTPAPRRPLDPLPGGRSRALEWFAAVRLNLLDILDLIDHEPQRGNIHQALVSLVAALAGYLRNSGPWDTAKRLHARAARQSTEPLASAIAYNNLGITCRLLGQLGLSASEWDEADKALTEAVEIFSQKIADPRTRFMGLANALNERGIVANERGLMAAENGDPVTARLHHLAAERHLRGARGYYGMSEEPDLIGRANSAKNLGVTYAGLGRPEMAEHWFERSRGEYQAIGDALGEVEMLNYRGRFLEDRGEKKAAARCYADALAALHQSCVVSIVEAAKAHEGLSRCSSTGPEFHGEQARRLWADVGVYKD
jgi:tetratricopeptide (TPR) repeat protein